MNVSRPMRMTESRKAILSVLRATRGHPTADEIHRLVREELPRISLGTVYRNLDRLEKEGLIRTLVAAGQQRRYDGVLREHHHIRCERCGRVDDIELKDAAEVEELVVDGRGYELRGYTLCFVGLCSECARETSEGHGEGGKK